MAGAIGGFLFGDARAHDHVGLRFNETRDETRSGRSVVSRIAIDHHIDVGFDVREHAADDVTLALQRLATNDGAGLPGELRRVVPRIVVVHVDARIRQRGAEGTHDIANRRGFVEGRDQHGDIDVTKRWRELLAHSVERCFSGGEALVDIGRMVDRHEGHRCSRPGQADMAK